VTPEDDAFGEPKLPWNRLLAVVTTAAILLGLEQIVLFGLLNPNMADWLSYREGAARLILTGSPYSSMQFQPYALPSAAWGAGFVYPPPAAWLVTFTLLGEWTFHALNLLGLVAFVSVAMIIARRELLPWRWVALVGALSLAHPGFRELREGQVTPLVAAAVGCMWLFPRKAGWMAVAAGMVKVFPGIAIVWAVRQRAPMLGATCLTAVAVLLGGGLWIDWLRVVLNGHGGCPEIALPSIACATGMPWLGFVAAGGLAVAAWRVSSDRLGFLLLTLAMVAPAVDLYWGYLMFPFMGALPLATYAIRWASDQLPSPRPALGTT
jgi:hypothetical protein